MYNYRSWLLFGWKFGFVPHGCQSIIFSDAHCTYSLTTSVFYGQPVVFCHVVFVPPLRPFRFGLFFPLIPDTRWNHRTAMAPGWSASATGQGHGLPKRNECNLYHNGYMNLEEIPWERGQSGPVQKCSCGPLDFLDCLSLCFVYGNEHTRKSTHFLATSLSIRAPWSSHYVYLRLSLFTPLFQQSSQFVQLVVQELRSNSRSVVYVCMFEYVYAYHVHVSYI